MVCILDKKIKVIQNEAIALFKVKWTYDGLEDITREHDDAIMEEHHHLVVHGYIMH